MCMRTCECLCVCGVCVCVCGVCVCMCVSACVLPYIAMAHVKVRGSGGDSHYLCTAKQPSYVNRLRH